MIKKNKVLTYLMVAGVLVVWGLIIYKVVLAYSGGTDDTYVPPTAAKEIFNDFAIPKDTGRLLLNYRDPFGLAAKKDTAKPRPAGRLLLKPVTAMPPAFNWDIIRYSGYIKNPGSKKLMAFLHINGKEVTMSEGETVDQVKLVRNLKDSILVQHAGKTRYIRIQSAI
ncbi:hypothetical protein [Mucilaginibacter sp. FT3.2]|uniref:hypothetical protein n=1 Tax=Mucilaginibacter sp. FT3.2 TaxID=2723090 RepID=UPI00160CD75F|nr:hypothetical protein [Mucilaginibacter sp. FT3.2]MBB6235278.1 hypothetical protein [Mucilaginibacter sp. FT3.2]